MHVSGWDSLLIGTYWIVEEYVHVWRNGSRIRVLDQIGSDWLLGIWNHADRLIEHGQRKVNATVWYVNAKVISNKLYTTWTWFSYVNGVLSIWSLWRTGDADDIAKKGFAMTRRVPGKKV